MSLDKFVFGIFTLLPILYSAPEARAQNLNLHDWMYVMMSEYNCLRMPTLPGCNKKTREQHIRDFENAALKSQEMSLQLPRYSDKLDAVKGVYAELLENIEKLKTTADCSLILENIGKISERAHRL